MGWVRCLKVTLQTHAEFYFCSCSWQAECLACEDPVARNLFGVSGCFLLIVEADVNTAVVMLYAERGEGS